MANTATITAKTGPAVQVTALVISNVTKFSVDCVREVLTVGQGGEVTSYPYKEFELSGSNTFTLTASGGAYSLTVT